jgi:hypothetical protein
MKLLKIIILFLTLQLSSQTQQPAPLMEYPITCYKKTNTNFHLFIIKAKNVYFYNFSDHPVADKEFKELFWKKSNVVPMSLDDFEMLCNTTIREDQMSERLKNELKKLK